MMIVSSVLLDFSVITSLYSPYRSVGSAEILVSVNKIILTCSTVCFLSVFVIIEPVHEKTNNFAFLPGPTQTRLYSDSIKLEA